MSEQALVEEAIEHIKQYPEAGLVSFTNERMLEILSWALEQYERAEELKAERETLLGALCKMDPIEVVACRFCMSKLGEMCWFNGAPRSPCYLRWRDAIKFSESGAANEQA